VAEPTVKAKPAAAPAVRRPDAVKPPAGAAPAVEAQVTAQPPVEAAVKPPAEAALTGEPEVRAEFSVRPAVDLEAAPWPVASAEAEAGPAARTGAGRLLNMLALVGLLSAMVVTILVILGPERGGLDLSFLPELLGRGAASPQATPTLEAEPTGSLAAVLTATEAPVQSPTLPPTETPMPTAAPLVHTVRAGETLSSVAARYGVTIDALIQANGLSSDVIRAGQQLVIPGQAQPPAVAPTPRPATHVVQRGENLAMIAQKYDVPVLDLMAANGISNPNLIKVGQELKIPGGESPPAPTEAPTTTSTATLAPTAVLTATAGLTGTAVAYEFAAPALLTPANGQAVEGAEDVLLNWTSVGFLADDTWYVVKMWRDDPAEPAPAAGWTRTTAWRIPASFRPAADAASRRFWWSVTVMRAREGEAPVAVGPTSEERWFEWR